MVSFEGLDTSLQAVSFPFFPNVSSFQESRKFCSNRTLAHMTVSALIDCSLQELVFLNWEWEGIFSETALTGRPKDGRCTVTSRARVVRSPVKGDKARFWKAVKSHPLASFVID